MRFQNLEQLKKIGDQLIESDFDRADCRWEPTGAIFILETARPPSEEPLKGAGLFRKSRRDWTSCRLTISGVKEISLWEEYDVKPPLGRLLEVESTEAGFRIRLCSAHGLRIDLVVGHLEGELA